MYQITDENKKIKEVTCVKDFFHKIDTKEKAYILGLFLSGGQINNDNIFIIDVSLNDKKVLEFVIENTGGELFERRKANKRKKIFFTVSLKIGQNQIIRDLHMLFGGRLKPERRIPIIKKELELYFLQGFFDAEGCITFGHRKDRNRIWQKISFTSHLKMLEGIQKILIKYGVSSVIRPKSGEKCFVMEICSVSEVLKMLDLIYSDNNFVILHRKYNKSKALRLELEENGEGTFGNNTVPSIQRMKV